MPLTLADVMFTVLYKLSRIVIITKSLRTHVATCHSYRIVASSASISSGEASGSSSNDFRHNAGKLIKKSQVTEEKKT